MFQSCLAPPCSSSYISSKFLFFIIYLTYVSDYRTIMHGFRTHAHDFRTWLSDFRSQIGSKMGSHYLPSQKKCPDSGQWVFLALL